jgi:hypothetical protein
LSSKGLAPSGKRFGESSIGMALATARISSARSTTPSRLKRAGAEPGGG